MTSKQKLASERNWTKARLLGSTALFSHGTYTPEEKLIASRINQDIDLLLKHWDIGTKTVGLKVGKKYIIDPGNGLPLRTINKNELKTYKDDPHYIITEIK